MTTEEFEYMSIRDDAIEKSTTLRSLVKDGLNKESRKGETVLTKRFPRMESQVVL